ncbi:hypothetical protein F5Y10DRAFT_249676 [Nemania abortiva]|nr:hypothetical protein F5Y10DRAFT_249676 [Nemania abortiva]
MVQFTTFALTVLASAGIVAAKSCHSGGIYCGFALLDRGDYINKIITNLEANNEPTDDLHVQQSLWTCLDHGDISFKEYCTLGCNGGDDNDDYCNGSPEQVAQDAADAAELAAEGRKFRPRRGAALGAKA